MSLCLADGDVVDDIRPLQPFCCGVGSGGGLTAFVFVVFVERSWLKAFKPWDQPSMAWPRHPTAAHLRSARPAIALKSINLLYPWPRNVIKSIYALHLLSFACPMPHAPCCMLVRDCMDPSVQQLLCNLQ